MRKTSRDLLIWCGGLVLLVFIGAKDAVQASGDAADEAMATIRPESIRADMRFLADDLLEGRGTGTRGHEIAAKYVGTQFEAMGLEPAGNDGTYFQRVPLRSGRPDEEKTSLVLVRSGKEEKLTFRQDYITRADPGRADTSVEAPVVYVGFGVTAPDQGYNDYKGVDVKGKIVAVIFGAPPSFESSMRAHYSSLETKLANAVQHGAVGVLGVDDPMLEQIYSFKNQVSDLAFPQSSWLDAHGQPNDYHPELRGAAYLSLDAAKKFFEGSGHRADEVFAAAKSGKPVSFAVPVTAKIHNVTKLEDIQSPNVIGKLRGSDPTLREQYVVYTAHLDHLGIGEPVKGDRIYNGALDNASGSACVLEIARAFARMKPGPRRSILFVAVTGEEEGLLGSNFFAHYPTVPKNSIVANINIDEDLMLWPLKDLVVFGAEHSSLGNVVNEAAKRLGLVISPDSQPEQVIFIRSDQYSFVKQGVPAIFPIAGTKSDDLKINAREIEDKWVANVYHQPQDDMNQPFDFDAGTKYARFNFLSGYLVAQKTERPTWNPGDFFGDHYNRN
jgi:hypothetical protein